MKKTFIILGVVGLVIIAGGALLLTGKNLNTSSQKTSSEAVYVFKTATSSKLGAYLVAANGMSLYTFRKDSTGLSTCVGECAENWPPYTVTLSGSLSVDPTINGTISTLTRADNTVQMTYKGAPLYFWKGDKAPGDTSGHNVNEVWFVAKP